MVLATVCGHRGGSASYRLDSAGLRRAIGLLAPAEACRAYEHPNLLAWRQLQRELGGADTVLAVFAADRAGPGTHPHVRALRRLAFGG